MSLVIGFQVGSAVLIDSDGITCAHGRAHSSVESVATFEVFTLDSAPRILAKIKPWEYLFQICEGDVEEPSFITDF